ncbi:CdaR family transcriptional regulator [Actinoplanes sp. TFC3]|uniref:PucR family transcriptional regulator n=1 Tax=Actinoplanes sp. TFC3 TaxID=1710355 RepID=UPI0008331D2A|nr:helix-turn-helix domain-containing protein [Actinoplanes sp. TFC3]
MAVDSEPTQLQELVDVVAARTGAPTTLEDRDLHLVASSGHEETVDEVRRRSILRRRSSPEVQQVFASFGIAAAEHPLRIPADAMPGLYARWCVPVRWRGVAYGYLWLLDPGETVPFSAVDALADVVDQLAVSMARRARTSDHTSWAVAELLSADAGARARAAEELQRDGLLPAHREVVLIGLARRDGGPVGPVNTWLLPRGVLSAPIGQRGALVQPASPSPASPSPASASPASPSSASPSSASPADVAERAARSLLAEHTGGVVAGVSGPVHVTDGYSGWRQVDAALRVGLRGQSGAVVVRQWADLGVLRLLSFAEPDELARTVGDARAQRLLDGDPDLLRTAQTYLDLAGNAQRTAAALAIHRQTLYHRLRRIGALTGYDLDDGEDRLALHVVLKFADFRG